MSDIVPARPEQIVPTQGLDELIPPVERRRVWQELSDAGLTLAPLSLPSRIFLEAACVVLAPVALLVLLVNWSFVCTAVELYIWAQRVTRPLATQVPAGCKTVQEAVLHLTPFRREDYEAGLWPREAIALKVRLLCAKVTGLPLESVKDETRLTDLFC